MIIVTLTITRTDGSVYWVEHFDSLDAGQQWLATEQTRPYWDPTYVGTFTTQTFPPPPPFPTGS